MRYRPIAFLSICLLLNVLDEATAQAQAGFLSPTANSVITSRRDFVTSGWIASTLLTPGRHLWVAIASVDQAGNPHLAWPKFYVKGSLFDGRVFDGGFNPSQAPQAMRLVLVRVDDATNQFFERWLMGPDYPGLEIRSYEIIASLPIYFP